MLQTRRPPFTSALLAALFAAQVASAGPVSPTDDESHSLVLEAPADLSGFDGRIIARLLVTVVGEPGDGEVAAGIRAGDPFSVPTATRALKALMSTGRFARGSLLVTMEPAGILLTFRLVPRKVIDLVEMDLHGAAVSVDGLVAEVDLRKDREIIPRDIADKAAQVQAFLSRQGYPAAKATFTLRDTDDPLRVVVALDVVPGQAQLLADRQLHFATPPSPELAKLAESYSVDKGTRVELEKFERADRLLSEALRAKSYAHATVTHRLDESPSGAVLAVLVDAGPLLVTHFRGNSTFDSATLQAALDIVGDSDRSAAHWGDTLRKFYVSRGFLDADVTSEVGAPSPDGTQHVTFHIVEQERVVISARHYPCLSETEIQHLENAPTTVSEINSEINSYLEEELPGSELLSRVSRTALHELTTGEGRVQAEPLALNPTRTLAPEALAHGVSHLEELYRSEGYLNAIVGPIQVARAACDPHFPGGRCAPLRLPETAFACGYDPTGLPTGATANAPVLACVPNAEKGLVCANEVSIYVPVLLGPRTILYDTAFSGVRTFSEQHLAEIAAIPLGQPVSSTTLEVSRRKIVDAYREEGFAYAEVGFTIEPSLNHSRARVKFDVHEGERVIVRGIEIRGLQDVTDKLARSRVTLLVGQPYRTSLARRSQELLGTLGVFGSVTVGLETPEVHEANKTVVIRVSETSSKITAQAGISTAEGPRFGLGYRNPNIGDAVSLNLNLRASILPQGEPFISPASSLGTALAEGRASAPDLVIARATAAVGLPDIGLGPKWRGQFDGLAVKDLQPDFALYKGLLGASLSYRPWKHVFMTFSTDVEINNVKIFANKDGDIASYLATITDPGQRALIERSLRFPKGTSLAFAQRESIAWDTRDNIFNPHTGFFLSLASEFVEWQGLDHSGLGNFGEFVKLTQSVSEHIPLGKKITLALSLRLAEVISMSNRSTTYPDRLSFMGGADTNRAWALESVIPADILQNPKLASSVSLRGGNLLFNPRAELRFPLWSLIDGVVFVDTGNTWSDVTYPFRGGHPFALRTSVGPGLRIETPVGPIALDFGFKTEKPVGIEDTAFWHFAFAIGVF